MKKVLEGYTQGKVVAWARHDLGLLACKLSTIAQRSFPDFCFFIPGGRPLLIEFKATGAKATRQQSDIHEQLRARGYETHVCDSILQAKIVILNAVVAACISYDESEVPRRMLRDLGAGVGTPGNVRGAGAMAPRAVHDAGGEVDGVASPRRRAPRSGDAKDEHHPRGVLRTAKGAGETLKDAQLAESTIQAIMARRRGR